jgi:chitinase
VVLSFIVGSTSNPCIPLWGGAYTLDEADAQLQLDRRLAQLRLTGGQADVSFGGQRGPDLASTCGDAASLQRAYREVVDRYQLTAIDLDIEGDSLNDEDGIRRRAEAVADLQSDLRDKGRQVDVWLTLPVSASGLTPPGISTVDTMLQAGVVVTGVNGMTMDFGQDAATAGPPLSATVIRAARALHEQVATAWQRARRPLDAASAWAKVGLTPMIGQADVPAERFTLDDAAAVNAFARTSGVGRLSMWSLNRDSTCQPPLPKVLSVVQTSCSGVDQGTKRFADALGTEADQVLNTASLSRPTTDGAPTPVASPIDDPAHSPFPIWDPLGTYPGGTKIVWHRQVYQARYWTSGFAPDTPVASSSDSPWTLLGPVLPGDTPAPLPTLPAGTYPQWDATRAYVAGSRVQRGLVPYQAKWWTQGQEPGTTIPGGSPWVLVVPES